MLGHHKQDFQGRKVIMLAVKSHRVFFLPFLKDSLVDMQCRTEIKGMALDLVETVLLLVQALRYRNSIHSSSCYTAPSIQKQLRHR